MEQHYFSGQGKLFAGKRNRAGVVDSYYWVGNCTELLIETEQAYLDHKENYTGAKIIDLRVLTGSEVNVTITLENLKRENWATAYKGALTLPIGATVTDETYLAPTEGNYLVLAKKNVTAVTVINPLAGGAAFSPVTDYQHLPPSNLVYVPTNSTMADTVVVIDYQSGASELMTAIGQPEEDLFLIFEGLNTVRDMERVVVNLFRVRFSTTNQLQLISDELSRFQLIGKAIYDEFRAEEGGYFSVTQNLGGVAIGELHPLPISHEHIESFQYESPPVVGVNYGFIFTSTNSSIPLYAEIFLLSGHWDSQGSIGAFSTGDVPNIYNGFSFNLTGMPSNVLQTSGEPVLIGYGNSVNGTVIEDEAVQGGGFETASCDVTLKFIW